MAVHVLKKQTRTAVLDLMNGSRLYEGFLLLTYNNKIICLNGTCEMCMQLIFLLLNWLYYCSFFHFGTNCLTDFQILNDCGGRGWGPFGEKERV